MRRSPHEIVMVLANALKSGKNDQTFSTVELRDKTGIHYTTLQNYFDLIGFIQNRMPKIAQTEDKKVAGIRIISMPNLNMSVAEELTLYLFDKAAFRDKTSASTPDWASKEAIAELAKRSVIQLTERGMHLSSEGILQGVELTERREKMLIEPIGETLSEFQESENEFPLDRRPGNLWSHIPTRKSDVDELDRDKCPNLLPQDVFGEPEYGLCVVMKTEVS